MRLCARLTRLRPRSILYVYLIRSGTPSIMGQVSLPIDWARTWNRYHFRSVERLSGVELHSLLAAIVRKGREVRTRMASLRSVGVTRRTDAADDEDSHVSSSTRNGRGNMAVFFMESPSMGARRAKAADDADGHVSSSTPPAAALSRQDTKTPTARESSGENRERDVSRESQENMTRLEAASETPTHMPGVTGTTPLRTLQEADKTPFLEAFDIEYKYLAVPAQLRLLSQVQLYLHLRAKAGTSAK